MKRILYHHRTQGRGVEGVHIRGMIDSFRKLGYEVDIVSPPGIDPYREKVSQVSNKKKKGISRFWQLLAEKTPQAFFEMLEIFYNTYSCPVINKKLKQKKYEFLYERYALFSFSCAFLAKKFRLPFILEVNDATIIERSRPLIMKIIAQFIEKKVFKRADIIITITNYFKKLIINTYKINPDKILVLPNAIDPERFKLDPKKKITKSDLRIKNKYIIGMVGAFVPWHGLDFLIKGIHDLLSKLDVHILLVGDGPVRSEIEALSKKLDIEKFITFTGFMDSKLVPYYIDLMDICVMPNSNKHGSPVKVLEYMAMGKPVLVPRYEPIEEIVTDGEEGLFFTPLDRKAFRTQLCCLIQDESLRKSMGEKAKKKAFKNFTWFNNAKKVIEKLNTLEV